jgi:hypothetical protein
MLCSTLWVKVVNADEMQRRCLAPNPGGRPSIAREGSTARDILDRTRHDGCGGRASGAELLTGVHNVSCRPLLRKIVLL